MCEEGDRWLCACKSWKMDVLRPDAFAHRCFGNRFTARTMYFPVQSADGNHPPKRRKFSDTGVQTTKEPGGTIHVDLRCLTQ